MLTYGEMISRIAELMLVRRPVLGFGVNLDTRRGARRRRDRLGGPRSDPPADGEPRRAISCRRDSHAAELLGVRLHSFDSAVEHALRVWEESEPLSAR